MAETPLSWTTDRLPNGTLRVAFRGQGGIGSEGNADGAQMCEAIREVLADWSATGLVIDLTGFEYRFGNWIAIVPLAALKQLGTGRVCLLASGETAAALRSLFEVGHLDQLVHVFGEIPEAQQYLSGNQME